jgi:NAD(P)-dependent dehydrogenase (short-subunit alcohol dehydrogenase family)
MNQHIFITGGASGIGLELARIYLAEGAAVSLFDIQPLDRALAMLQAQVPTAQRVQGFSLDVVDVEQVAAVFRQAADPHPPTRVIHCAGVTLARAFADTSADAFASVININVLGSRHVVAAALPLLGRGGQLALVASMAGLIGCYGYSAYAASKYAVVGLAEVLRLELRAQGIDVSVVCPPEVDTPMVQQERLERPKGTSAMKLLAGTLSVEQACRSIHDGLQRRHFLIIPGYRARLLHLSASVLPGALNRWFSDRLLDRADGAS